MFQVQIMENKMNVSCLFNSTRLILRVVNSSVQKHIFRTVAVSVAILSVGGCSTQKQRIDPTIVSTSYDYTKPVDIAAQSKPVWVLPVINKGWIPARVDAKTGDWISGHYQATIVQEGYWATQEEAELSGRPYIVAGESSPIIPTPVGSGTTTGDGGGQELDINALQNRVGELEKSKSQIARTSASNDQMAALSAQMQALAGSAPVNPGGATGYGMQRTAGYSNDVQVPMVQPPSGGNQGMNYSNGSAQVRQALPAGGFPTRQQANYPVAPQTQGSTIVLPTMPAGTNYEIPTNSSRGNVMVKYLSDREVEINYGGQIQRVQVANPNDKIQITLPSY
jgi:hypothetical protein